MGGSKQISGRERRPEQHNRHGKLEMQLKQDNAGRNRHGDVIPWGQGGPSRGSSQYSFLPILPAALWLSIFCKVQALRPTSPEPQTSGHLDMGFPDPPGPSSERESWPPVLPHHPQHTELFRKHVRNERTERTRHLPAFPLEGARLPEGPSMFSGNHKIKVLVRPLLREPLRAEPAPHRCPHPAGPHTGICWRPPRE